MSIFFSPNGTLDLNTDPSDMPESSAQGNYSSGEMQRCKNLTLNEKGVAQTRGGIVTAIQSIGVPVFTILEQGGQYYSGAGNAIYLNATSLAATLTKARWSGILYNSYNSTTENLFMLNGFDRKRVEGSSVYEWGVAAPTIVPVIAAWTGSGLTGDYNAKYTYCRKEAAVVVSESDPSDAASAAVTCADDSLNIYVTASSDSQVTHIRIYRTEGDGTTYYHDQDVANTTQTVETTTADSALGTQVATNHDRPPLGNYIIGPNYNGTCFILKDNLLYWCLAKRPEYWPTEYFVEVSPIQQPGKCAVFWDGRLYYLSVADIYLIQGTGTNTFFPYSQSAITGTQGPLAVAAVAGVGIFHVGSDGIYLFANTDTKLTGGRYDRTFNGETVNDVPGVSREKLDRSWLIQFQNRLYFGYADKVQKYPSNVLVFDLITKRSWYYRYPVQFSCVMVDRTNSFLMGGASNGFVYRLEHPTVRLDGSTAISWELESKDFTLQTRAHYPRWVKYDVDASRSGCSATGSVVLDDTVHQTHSITGSRNTKRRLVSTGNGSRESLRVAGTGPVKIFGIEAE